MSYFFIISLNFAIFIDYLYLPKFVHVKFISSFMLLKKESILVG